MTPPPATAARILTQPPDLTGLAGPLRDWWRGPLVKDPADRPTARELLDGLLTVAAPVGDPTPVAAMSPAGADQPSGGSLGPVTPPAAGDGQGEPSTAGTGPAGRRSPLRRRWLTGVGAAVAVIAVLVPVTLFGPRLFDGRSTPDPSGSAGVDPAAGGPATTASGTGTPTPSPSAASPSTSVDRTRAILAGQRQILLHVVEIDRDLSLPFDGEVGVSDGTKPDARFVLDPVGVDFMIKSLNPEIAHRPCLGVKIDEEGYASLVGTECNPGGATLFGVSREGKDDKGRLSYAIVSEKYGVVQWSPSQKKIYVEVLGDAPVGTTFSLVDRGAV